MGKMKKNASDPASTTDSSMPPPPISDALLFSTLCIVGVPVEVQVKDGSIYSGIFHTACLDHGYGVVLKKASKIREGRHDKNFAVGDLVDTLVIHAADLVQVIVKDLVLPVEGLVGNFAGDGLQAAMRAFEVQGCGSDAEKEPDTLVDDNRSPSCHSNESKEETSLHYATNDEDVKKVNEGRDTKKVPKNHLQRSEDVKHGSQDAMCLAKVEEPSPVRNVLLQERQFEEDGSTEKVDFCQQSDEIMHKLHCSSHGHPVYRLSEVNSADEDVVNSLSDEVSKFAGCFCPAVLPVTSEAPESRIMTKSLPISPNLSVPGNKTFCKAGSKGSKLNPNAKGFVPSFANSGPVPLTVRTIASSSYMLDNYPVMPIAGAETGVEINSFASRSTLPPKLLQSSNLVAGHNAFGAQGSLSNVANAGIRQQSLRLSGQYHPVQAGTAYIHPNSQAIMAGRLGQLVYMQPFSQDVTQVPATVVSHGMAVPLIAQYQPNIPKVQGTVVQPLQICVNAPILPGGNQPFSVPSQFPFSQPLPAIRPFSFPGGNGIYTSTFQRT